MQKTREVPQRFLAWLSAVLLLVLLLSGAVWGQAVETQTPPPQAPAVQEQKPPSQKTPAAAQDKTSADQSPTAAQSQPQAETKISPKEAEALFHSVDEILYFAAKDTGLPIKHEVKRRLASREEVSAFLKQNMAEDKDAQRLQRSELVLKKFGLLPRDFDLQTFLVGLLEEQVAGYYDPKSKTVNLLDWVGAEQQRPIMAHELTHALQDQSFGLRKWMKAGDTDLTDKKQVSSADIENDEISSARQAVVEGQAMVVLIDYMLAPMGHTLVDSPQFAEALKADMIVGTADSPQFRSSPIFIKESLTFPYLYGIDFVAQVLRAGGKEKAYAGMFANPPRSTRQIMEPQTYLSGEKIDPLPPVDFKQIFKNYEPFDIGAIGEFDVAVLIHQYAGKEVSHEMYPHWRGGYYYAVRPKANPAAPLGLLYVSRWSNAERAGQFAAIYAKSLKQRYKKVEAVLTDSGKPEPDLANLARLNGKHDWMTEEGEAIIEVKADTVIITEGLDANTNAQLKQQVFAAQK